MEKIIGVISLFFTLLFSVASFAANEVVVIPLISSSSKISNPIIGSGFLSSSSISTVSGPYYMMVSETVTLSADGRCAVSATGYFYTVDSGDDMRGPSINPAYQAGSATPQAAVISGPRMLYVGDRYTTGSAITTAFYITGGIAYKFGCAYNEVPSNWENDSGNCQVSWVCAENN